MEYLLILLTLLSLGVFFEWKYRIELYGNKKQRIIISLFFLVVGLAWDYFAVQSNHWLFPGQGLIGLKLGSLPIEEFLFMLIVPYWIIVTYQLLRKKIK